MNRLRMAFYAAVTLAGLAAGLFVGSRSAMATSPEGEVSGGEQPASVWYDEHWYAVEAFAGNGLFDPSAQHPQSGTSMRGVVTKWRVHGHIHFQ